MPRVGLESKNRVFERTKTVHGLDHPANVMGTDFNTLYKKIRTEPSNPNFALRFSVLGILPSHMRQTHSFLTKSLLK
jgi:hypothetical protein